MKQVVTIEPTSNGVIVTVNQQQQLTNYPKPPLAGKQYVFTDPQDLNRFNEGVFSESFNGETSFAPVNLKNEAG